MALNVLCTIAILPQNSSVLKCNYQLTPSGWFQTMHLLIKITAHLAIGIGQKGSSRRSFIATGAIAHDVRILS